MTTPLFDSSQLRQACGHFPTGVTAVTAVSSTGSVAALTVNSFTSVSLTPAQVLFCLAHTSSSFPTLMSSTRIAIHILRNDQEDVARLFATSGLTGEDKLAGVSWLPGPDGVPLLADSTALLVGKPGQIVTSGDHSIFVVDIDHVDLKPSPAPALVFYRGRFVDVNAGPSE